MRNFHTIFREILDQIEPEDYFVSDVYGTTTIYFMLHKDAFNKLFPRVWNNLDSGEISIEYPTNNPEANAVRVEMSPSLNGCDYDWISVDLSYEDIEPLFSMGIKFMKEE